MTSLINKSSSKDKPYTKSTTRFDPSHDMDDDHFFDEYTTFVRHSPRSGDIISNSRRQDQQDNCEEVTSTAENRANESGTFNNGKPFNVQTATSVVLKAPTPFPRRQTLFEDSYSLSPQTSQAPASSRLSPILPSCHEIGGRAPLRVQTDILMFSSLS